MKKEHQINAEEINSNIEIARHEFSEDDIVTANIIIKKGDEDYALFRNKELVDDTAWCIDSLIYQFNNLRPSRKSDKNS